MMHDTDAERSVLNACANDKRARQEARNVIDGPDFYHAVHQDVWDAMFRLDHHGKPVDFVTLKHVLASHRGGVEAVVELVGLATPTETVAHHAAIVRSWAVKRRMHALATKVQQQAESPDVNAVGFAASTVTQFTTIRDSGQSDDDVTVMMLDELEALPERPEDWVIEGLIEKGDRLILTGGEGLGKSTMLRQIAVFAAAGMHPFDTGKRIPPIRALIYDSENSERQIKRKVGRLHDHARLLGQRDPGMSVSIDCPGRIDIARDKDLARIHRLLDLFDPQLIVIGPLYRLSPRALQTDDEASPVLAALDTIKDRGVALLIEAHAGHATGANGREWRPRGSSALMGWPEFGYGMANVGNDHADVVPWRGPRDERNWPGRVRRDKASMSWTKVDDFHPAMTGEPA